MPLEFVHFFKQQCGAANLGCRRLSAGARQVTNLPYIGYMRIYAKAVIFDYGHVLSGPQPATDVQAMASLLEFDVRSFQESYWRYRVAYDQAALDPTSYWNAVAQRDLPPADIAKLIDIDNKSWTHPNPIMPAWAQQLRQAGGLRTAILSNIPAPVRDAVERCEWLPQFDARTYSCDLRVTKPSPEIYQHCLAQLGIAPSETLFLDDRPENIQAAEALGIHGIVFATPQQTAAEIHRRFSIPVPLVATL
jgi:putative hydrolase of the HAD superfamily